jgi:hypothetical protein
MAAETDLKWKLPGWRIESRYNNNVLIGNWGEERRKVNYYIIICHELGFYIRQWNCTAMYQIKSIIVSNI